MKNLLISVIIPVYNTEKYVEECLNSVLKQIYQNIEVIVIDDGSTDSSPDICRRLAKEDERIQYYQQVNQGVVAARKKGVQVAKGEYVLFIDSDDYIDSSLIEQLVNGANDYDLITSGYYMNEQQDMKIYDVIEAGEYISAERLKYIYERMVFIDDTEGILGYMWAKLFKRNLTQSVLADVSDEIFLGEDQAFLYRYILQCKSIKITRICGYYYRLHQDSVIHTVNKNFLQNVNLLYNSLEEVFSKHSSADKLIPQLEMSIYKRLEAMRYYMGFTAKDRRPQIQYIFPLINEVIGKNIVLYGAGEVGKRYKIFLETTQICNVQLWIDKKWNEITGKKWDVHFVEELLVVEFDVIVLAVARQEVAEEIKKELIEMGISEEKIFWKESIHVMMR